MRTVGRYEICGLLGRGGMGAVYKARLPELGKMVALKVLRPEETLEAVVGMEELTRRFRREARIMAALRHPHIAQVWDYAEEDAPHFSMEYLCGNLGALMGETYRAEARTRRIAPDRAAAFAAQTLQALARLHHAGLLHRDVKPFNIMLTDADRVKLIDFGLSRLRGETGRARATAMATGALASDDADDGAMPGTIKVGTPFYTAPEQEADPAAADRRADLYSVGVMLFRMLFGALPSDGGARPGQPARVPEGEMPDALAAGWNEFFARALARDPAERFADAGAMLAALDARVAEWRGALDAVCRLSEEELFGAGADAAGQRGARPRATPAKVRSARTGWGGRCAAAGGSSGCRRRARRSWIFPLGWSGSARARRMRCRARRRRVGPRRGTRRGLAAARAGDCPRRRSC
jgi:serine/threonine-protein kinase